MPGYAGWYAVSPFALDPVTGLEAADNSVLYWDGDTNSILGSSYFTFNATAKAVSIGPIGQIYVYNTYTDALHYERLNLGWEDDVGYLRFQTEGGTARNLQIVAGNFLTLQSGGGAYGVVLDTSSLRSQNNLTATLGTNAYRWITGYFGGTADALPLEVKASNAQTANLQEWQDSNGTALLAITSTGGVADSVETIAPRDLANIKSAPANAGGRSIAQSTTNIIGSLAVTGAARADNLSCRNLQVYNTISIPIRWEDLRIEPVARNTGSKAPSFLQYMDDAGLGDTGTTSGLYLYKFDDAAAGSEKEIFFQMQMPHNWLAGTDLHLHVHWIGDTSDTTAAPRWGLEYSFKDIGQTFGATDTIYTDGINQTGPTTTDPNITAGIHYMSEFSTITPTSVNNNASAILIGRLFRDSANAADTYNVASNSCGLLYIDCHYQIGSLGSKTELGEGV